MKSDTNSVRKFEYKAEMKQLLEIIVHSLYTHPEIFLRELISNASDALNKVRFRKLTDGNVLDPELALEIKIELDSKKQMFSIEDSGVGMTEDELINNIGTVARSGTMEFLKEVKEGRHTFDENLIGRFGVGFYSVFMVADEVTIETRHADIESKGYVWKSDGGGTFTIEQTDKKSRGTKIYFKLKDSAKEFCEEFKVKEVVNRYSNFADFPVFLKKEKINKVSALWHKKSDELGEAELNDFYKFITNDFDEPLGHLHLSLEGAVNFKGLLFIPRTVPFDLLRGQNEKSLHLYSNKILVQDDCKELIPEYLRFVKGVVDTVDLPLNVSRETVQSSPVMGKIKNILTGKVLSFLRDWMQNEPEKYKEFHGKFGPLLKTGVNMDFTNRDKIIELLMFESSRNKKGELTSLKEYTMRMKADQKEIYYLSGEHRDALERNPNLEYFKKNGIEVFLLTDPIDVFIGPSINEYDKKPIKSIDKADIDLIPESKIKAPEDKLTDSLVSTFKEVLKDKVENVVISKRLVDSPVTLVIGKNGVDTQTEKMMKAMNKEYKLSKRIMEVNPSHPLIKNLSKMYISDNNSPLLRKCIVQLYEGASFIDGTLSTPADFVERMVGIMEEATK